ncbi:MAG TPA: hypothetical protein VI958_02050 [Acidobacteriota bacterium]
MLAGFVYGTAGAFIGLLPLFNDFQSFPWYFFFCAITTGFMSGTGVWWLMVGWYRNYRAGSGALAGAAVAATSHLVFWSLIVTISAMTQPENPFNPSPKVNILETIYAMTVWTWMTAGIISIPVGAVLGAILASLQRRRSLQSQDGLTILDLRDR